MKPKSRVIVHKKAYNLVTLHSLNCWANQHLGFGLPLGLEAPILMPNGVILLFFSSASWLDEHSTSQVLPLLAKIEFRVNVQVLQELDERVQRMNEEHRRDARRRAEELVQPLLAPDFFTQ